MFLPLTPHYTQAVHIHTTPPPPLVAIVLAISINVGVDSPTPPPSKKRCQGKGTWSGCANHRDEGLSNTEVAKLITEQSADADVALLLDKWIEKQKHTVVEYITSIEVWSKFKSTKAVVFQKVSTFYLFFIYLCVYSLPFTLQILQKLLNRVKSLEQICYL